MRLWLTVLAGCALATKSPPVTVRYYSPPLADGSESRSQRPSARLARISAASHLGYAIAYRTSPVELQLHDLDRWTDTPDIYVKRALEQRLAHNPSGRSLDVEVLAFEELHSPPSGRVQLSYTIRTDERVLASDIVTVVRSARSERRADVVVAIGHALDAAADQIAARVAHAVQPRSDDDVPRHRVTRRR